MKTWSCHTFSDSDHGLKWKVSKERVHTQKTETHIGFYGHCNSVFEAVGGYCHYGSSQEARLFFTEEEIRRGITQREPDELRKQYIQEKGCIFIEVYKCDWLKMYKTEKIVRHHLDKPFSYKMPLRKKNFQKNEIWKSICLCSM